MKAENRKLYQPIIAALQADIASGLYPLGGRLPPERVLVERFQVSRLTVREAMIGMEILGLVEARRGSGVYVTAVPDETLKPDDLDIGAFELTLARQLIEGETAAQAATVATDDDIAAIAEELERMIALSHLGRTLDTEAADRDFHLTIAQATHNEALVFVVRALWDIRDRSVLSAEILRRSRSAGVTPVIADHSAIHAAIAARDPQAARQAMHDHLGRVIDELLAATGNEAAEA